MVDNRQYENQVIAALQGILRSLVASGGVSASRTTSTASVNTSGLVTAINNISTKLDSIKTSFDTILGE